MSPQEFSIRQMRFLDSSCLTSLGHNEYELHSSVDSYVLLLQDRSFCFWICSFNFPQYVLMILQYARKLIFACTIFCAQLQYMAYFLFIFRCWCCLYYLNGYFNFSNILAVEFKCAGKYPFLHRYVQVDTSIFRRLS